MLPRSVHFYEFANLDEFLEVLIDENDLKWSDLFSRGIEQMADRLISWFEAVNKAQSAVCIPDIRFSFGATFRASTLYENGHNFRPN